MMMFRVISICLLGSSQNYNKYFDAANSPDSKPLYYYTLGYKKQLYNIETPGVAQQFQKSGLTIFNCPYPDIPPINDTISNFYC